jgi:polyisoprenoid-binding protein YceI
MNKMMNYFLIVAIALTVVSCKGPGGDKAKVGDTQEQAEASDVAQSLAVNLESSVVTWLGSKPSGKHNGTIKLSAGALSVEAGAITAGEFTMDMNSLESTDPEMNADNNGKLTKHLKDGDFFDVTNHPTAKFVISKIEDIANHATEEALELEGATHYVTGNLTLKDSTKGVSFPAIISVSDAGVTAKAEFTINRTDWGMHYGGDKSLGDKFIHPEVKVGFDIQAN